MKILIQLHKINHYKCEEEDVHYVSSIKMDQTKIYYNLIKILTNKIQKLNNLEIIYKMIKRMK